MARDPFDFDGKATRAVDRGHDADRQALGLEHGALLDVEFHVREHVGPPARRAGDAVGIQPECRQRLAHRRARAIVAVEQLHVERAGDRAASEQRRAEAHAFLVREAQDLERERKARAALVQRMDTIDRGHHAQHAVVLAGIAHGVEVRAQHQARRAGSVAFIAADHVADRVEPGAHAGLAHPALYERIRRALFR